MTIETKECKNSGRGAFKSLLGCGMAAAMSLAGASTTYAHAAVSAQPMQESGAEGKVTGLRHIVIHVLDLEASRELYQGILGFELVDAEVLGGTLQGMLLLRLKANDLTITLSVPPPQAMDGYGPIGNTNHNHFMLKVDDIGPIGDSLKAAGYALENDNYVQDQYTFFTGPNGEIVGLSSYE